MIGVVQMLRLWKATRVFLFSICALLLSLGQETQSPASERPPLVVELSARKSTIYPGGLLRLGVTIRNSGNKDLFIERSIDQQLDVFTLYLQYGSKTETARTVGVGDYFGTSRPPFPALLAQHWIALGPGKFYGGEVVMNPKDYPHLRVPGRYLVKGQYISGDFPLRGYDDEVSKLPFKTWKGRIETNSIWIEVTTKTKKGNRH
jgi:hypothetical protein